MALQVGWLYKQDGSASRMALSSRDSRGTYDHVVATWHLISTRAPCVGCVGWSHMHRQGQLQDQEIARTCSPRPHAPHRGSACDGVSVARYLHVNVWGDARA